MRPFEGVRVLDLTHVFAGPFCTYQLAVLGADVIKIEPPADPDMTRDEGVVPALNDELYGTNFQSQNAGKRAMTLDLKTEKGRDVMRRLIADADVLVQNYAGDALEKLGFGYDAVAEINPTLIYCSMTGFGRSGPKADHPAYDVVIQAFSGLMSANGSAESGPLRVGPAMVDYGTGAHAALAISSALYQRQRTGKGQKIDVAMLDAALMLMTSTVADTIASGVAPRANSNLHPDLAGYRTYETKDGLLMVGAFTNRQLSRLFRALGETCRAEEVREATRPEVRAARDRDTETIRRRLLTQTADEWETLLNEARVPAARVRTLDEALAEKQIESRQVLQASERTQELGGPGTLPTAAFSFAHGTPAVDRPPPRLGEHTAEILEEHGYSQDGVAAMRAARVI